MALMFAAAVRLRKKVFQNLKKALHDVDSVVEMQQRLIGRVLKRRRGVPEVLDLRQLAQMQVKLLNLIGKYDSILRQGYKE